MVGGVAPGAVCWLGWWLRACWEPVALTLIFARARALLMGEKMAKKGGKDEKNGKRRRKNGGRAKN